MILTRRFYIDNQEFLQLIIISSFPMTFSFDSRLILLGEIRGQTPLTAERVKSRHPQFHLLCQTKYVRKDNDRAMLFTPSWYSGQVTTFFSSFLEIMYMKNYVLLIG